jgi:uncharacterized protein YukJ
MSKRTKEFIFSNIDKAIEKNEKITINTNTYDHTNKIVCTIDQNTSHPYPEPLHPVPYPKT